MSQETDPTFFELNLQAAQVHPTTYESMRATLLREILLTESLPDDVRQVLLAAVDYVALAYEQANIGRAHLYASLTNDAFLKASLALELTLRHCLQRGKSAKFSTLIRDGIAASLLPAGDEYALLWEEMRKSRNEITHRNADYPTYGPMMGRVIRVLIQTICGMYTKPNSES